MKKPYIFIATVIVCCLFLGIGFYAGYATKSITSHPVTEEIKPETTIEEEKADSLFEKQNKCASYYNVYKDKLSYVNDSQGTSIDNLSVSYSPFLDNCIASWVESLDIDGDGISDYYGFNIVNASKGDQTLYGCYTAVLKQTDGCSMLRWRDYLYDLTNSD